MVNRLSTIFILSMLTACTAPPMTEVERPVNDFGLAVRSNMDAQIIAEEGEVTTLGPAPGERRALAVGRYQTDQVEQPVEIFTRGE